MRRDETPSDSRFQPGAALGRRALPRVAVSLPARIGIVGLPGRLQARACDVGPGGVCIATCSPFAIHDLRGVGLTTPSGVLEFRATGCWQQEVSGDAAFLSGIRFDDVSHESLERLWDLVHERSKAIARWLAEQSELAGLDVQERTELAQVTRTREARCGHRMYRQGVRDESIFLVTRGALILERRTQAERTLVIDHVPPGRIAGGLGLVANSVASETAIVERDVSLLEISRGAFENLLLASPRLALQLWTLVVDSQLRRLNSTLGRLVDER